MNKIYQEMNNVGRNFNRVMGDSYDMVEILAMEPAVKDPVKPQKVRINRGSIAFNDVRFQAQWSEDRPV